MNIFFKFRQQVFYGLGAVLLLLLAPSVLQAKDFLEPGGDAIQGAKTWAENCSRCHNMRDPQDLRDDQWVTTAFHMRIRAGLTGQQTRDILEFLQSANDAAIAPVESAAQPAMDSAASISGSEIYNSTCIACHGGDGKGTVPGAPDLSSENGPLKQSDEILLRRITEGFKSPESPLAMPPRGGNTSLTEDNIQAVLDYLRDSFGQ